MGKKEIQTQTLSFKYSCNVCKQLRNKGQYTLYYMKVKVEHGLIGNKLLLHHLKISGITYLQ